MTKPLRIGLLMQGGQGWIGGSEYIKNIILALGSLPEGDRESFEVYLFASDTLNQSFVEEVTPHLKKIFYSGISLDPYTSEESLIAPAKLSARILSKLQKQVFNSKNLNLDRVLRQHGIDFVYPYFVAAQTSYKRAAWIYDFQHKHLTDLFTKEEIVKRDDSFSRMAHHSSTVVLSSKTAQSDFQTFFPVAAHRSKVLSFKTSPQAIWYDLNPVEVQRKYCLPDRFFIVSNQFWQHKNHVVIFQALKQLQERSLYPIVVCTGHIHDYRKPDYADTILQMIHSAGIAHQVYLLGLIPKLDQIQLLRRAIAVIQPSLFEGWNTTVEDARLLGKPIVLSNILVHLEQNPPQSYFFDSTSSEHLADVLAETWASLPLCPNLAQETLAKTQGITEIQTFAKTFLDIGRTA